MVGFREFEIELKFVTAGLDPAIHRLRKILAKGMDARVTKREDALRASARA